jgi:hypothetical protein
MSGVPISPAGWALRHFAIDEMETLLNLSAPRLVEISKDFLRDGVSLKTLAAALSRIRHVSRAELAFAGSTDLMACAGLSWDEYRRYLAVQIAQARFLECSLFRLFAGAPSPSVTLSDLTARVRDFCADLTPIAACVEIHGGIESHPDVLAELLRCTPVKVVIDFENAHRAGLTRARLLEIVPLDRVAYVHQRNLPGTWTEHQASLEDELQWQEFIPTRAFLWEPKTVEEPRRVQELFREYRRSH